LGFASAGIASVRNAGTVSLISCSDNVSDSAL
jgi:hypothetical protein